MKISLISLIATFALLGCGEGIDSEYEPAIEQLTQAQVPCMDGSELGECHLACLELLEEIGGEQADSCIDICDAYPTCNGSSGQISESQTHADIERRTLSQ